MLVGKFIPQSSLSLFKEVKRVRYGQYSTSTYIAVRVAYGLTYIRMYGRDKRNGRRERVRGTGEISLSGKPLALVLTQRRKPCPDCR